MKIHVLIPVCGDGSKIKKQVEALQNQKRQPDRVTLLLSEKCRFSENIENTGFPVEKYQGITNDKNAMLNAVIRESAEELIMILNEGALPNTEQLIASLESAFTEEDVMIAGAREVYAEKKGSVSHAMAGYYYQEKPLVKKEEDIYFHGLETFFVSSNCAMYRKAVFEEVPMFEVNSLSFTEQVVAADAVHLGYHVAYVPEAEVLVSKKVSIAGSFREAFDYGVLLKKHIQSFGLYVIDEHSYDVIRKNMEQVYREQYRYAKKEVLSKGNVFAVPCLRLMQSANKWGNKLGKRYHRLPDKLNRAFSNTKEYWA